MVVFHSFILDSARTPHFCRFVKKSVQIHFNNLSNPCPSNSLREKPAKTSENLRHLRSTSSLGKVALRIPLNKNPPQRPPASAPAKQDAQTPKPPHEDATSNLESHTNHPQQSVYLNHPNEQHEPVTDAYDL